MFRATRLYCGAATCAHYLRSIRLIEHYSTRALHPPSSSILAPVQSSVGGGGGGGGGSRP